MSTIADMVEKMLADGVPATAIVLAVRTADASRDASRIVTTNVTPSGRSKEAERAFQYRKRQRELKALAKANDVASAVENPPLPERDASRRSVTLPSILSINSGIEKEGIQESKKEVVARARGERLPPDWKPDDRLRLWCRSKHGMTDAEIDEAVAEFHDFWSGVPGTRGCKTNWPGTFRNRIRETIHKIKARRTNGQSKSVVDAADRLLEKVRQFERNDEPDLLADVRDGTGAPHVRLLSSR